MNEQSYTLSLNGKVTVVTGAARGIGRGIAHSLAQAGAIVYVTDRRTRHDQLGEPGTIEDTVDEITLAGGEATPVQVDFTVDHQVEALFQRIEREHGHLDILVANAMNGNAIPFHMGPVWELDPASWDHMFTSGVRNHLIAAVKAAPLLLKSKGTIILTGYRDTNHPETGGNLYYDLAMHTITRLTQNLAHDFAVHDVNVVAISPGLVRTEVITAALGPHPEGSQSIEYPGRAVVALVSDSNIATKRGQIFSVGELARAYQFTDVDGSQPN